METEKKPLIILTGPTAVGKTDLSIALAKAVNGADDLSGFHAGLPLHGYRFGKDQPKRDAGRTSLSGG